VYYPHKWHNTGCHGNVARGIEKGNFRSFIYSHSSTIRANSVKIGPGDAEITGLAEITKNILKTSAKHKRAERVG